MRQTVNLYQACFYPEKKSVESIAMVSSIALLPILMIGSILSGIGELYSLEKNLQALEKRRNETEVLVKTFQSQMVSLKSLSATLASAEMTHQALLQKRQNIEASLSGGVQYSTFLSKLAQIIPAQVWLESIQLSGGESTLKGWAVDRHALSQFSVSLEGFLRDRQKTIGKIDIQYKDEAKKYYFVIAF